MRNKNISGFKFLRQHPVFYHENKGWIDFYVADFYCNKLKLIIELDGGIHDFQKDYDKDRDEKLASKGFHIVRLANKTTGDLKNLEILLNQLIEKRKIQLNSGL